jgi:hypothetical protein
MSQNTSHAVMAQRIEPHDSLDYFPTPPWATRALCQWLQANVGSLGGATAWEPACGEGHMARPLAEYFHFVMATDVHDYGHGEICDFLFPNEWAEADWDWIITNPPFRLAEQFILRGLDLATRGVAVLVRTSFLEGGGRYANLFSQVPPSVILQFAERVPMHKGRLDPNGSTATAYCWIIWRKDYEGPTRFGWLAPSRRRLERPEDYQEIAA